MAPSAGSARTRAPATGWPVAASSTRPTSTWAWRPGGPPLSRATPPCRPAADAGRSGSASSAASTAALRIEPRSAAPRLEPVTAALRTLPIRAAIPGSPDPRIPERHTARLARRAVVADELHLVDGIAAPDQVDVVRRPDLVIPLEVVPVPRVRHEHPAERIALVERAHPARVRHLVEGHPREHGARLARPAHPAAPPDRPPLSS